MSIMTQVLSKFCKDEKLWDWRDSTSSQPTKRLLLFDIDQTLVNCNLPNTEGVLEALSKGFGQELKEVVIPKEARGTALAMAKYILKENGIPKTTEGFMDKITQSRHAYLEIIKKRVKDGRICWEALPKVKRLLSCLAQREDVMLGLITANPREIAQMKLISAGIPIELFKQDSELFGAFGCEDENRSVLVQKMMTKFSDLLEVENDVHQNVVVIGDTPNDISCAHYNNVACVAVATGDFKPDSLRDADHVLINGFADVESCIDVLISIHRS